MPEGHRAADPSQREEGCTPQLKGGFDQLLHPTPKRCLKFATVTTGLLVPVPEAGKFETVAEFEGQLGEE